MHRPTIGFALAMILLGVLAYLGTGRESMTAMIPTFIGTLILLAGIAAAKARTPALIAALVLAALGFLGPLGRVVPAAMSGELVMGAALASQLVFMALCVALAVSLVMAIRRPAAQL